MKTLALIIISILSYLTSIASTHYTIDIKDVTFNVYFDTLPNTTYYDFEHHDGEYETKEEFIEEQLKLFKLEITKYPYTVLKNNITKNFFIVDAIYERHYVNYASKNIRYTEDGTAFYYPPNNSSSTYRMSKDENGKLYYRVSIKGLAQGTSYIVLNRIGTYKRSTIHHEIFHGFYENKTTLDNYCNEHFEYGKSTDLYAKHDLYESGFVSTYAMTRNEEDLCETFSHLMFQTSKYEDNLMTWNNKNKSSDLYKKTNELIKFTRKHIDSNLNYTFYYDLEKTFPKNKERSL